MFCKFTFSLSIIRYHGHHPCCSILHTLISDKLCSLFYQHTTFNFQHAYMSQPSYHASRHRHIHSVRRSLTRQTVLTLVRSLVVSKVDYCNSVLAGVSTHLLDRLQTMLHAAARLIFSARKSEHIGPLLCELHWLLVPERIRFLLCVLAFRCLHGTAQSYLVGSLRRAADVDGRRHLRSANTVSLVVPQPSARHSATAPFLRLQPEHATTFRQRSRPHCRF